MTTCPRCGLEQEPDNLVLLLLLSILLEKHKQLATASLAYDEAIRACADDPERMSSFCSAQGDDLDALYANWMRLASDDLF